MDLIYFNYHFVICQPILSIVKGAKDAKIVDTKPTGEGRVINARPMSAKSVLKLTFLGRLDVQSIDSLMIEMC